MKAGKPEQFLKSGFADRDPSFSPDGRWLAYRSNESGQDEVYVRAFPPPSSGQGGKWQVSNSGGTKPRWSRKGHELMYQSGDQIMAASYTAKGDAFVAEKPRVWLAKLGGALSGDWDLAAGRQAPGGGDARGNDRRAEAGSRNRDAPELRRRTAAQSTRGEVIALPREQILNALRIEHPQTDTLELRGL